MSRKHGESSQGELGSKIMATFLREQLLFSSFETMIKIVNVCLAIKFSSIMSSLFNSNYLA